MTGQDAPSLVLTAYLHGIWRLERHITDRLAATDGQLAGQMEFVADPERPGEFLWLESGLMALGGYRGQVSRHWRCRPIKPAVLAFDYLDGRPFHAWDGTAEPAEVEHACGADRYIGCYRRTSASSFRVEWLVTGPRKHYTLTSDYTRYPAADAA